MYLNYEFNYEIKKSSGTVKGLATGRVLMEQNSYFVKKLILQNSTLEWEPTDISTLTVLYPLSINYSDPKLDDNDKQELVSILNDHAGESKLLMELMMTLNSHYHTILKDHLNKEELVSDKNIRYSYKNINFTFYNHAKNFTIEKNKTQGLNAFFLFEL